MPKTVIAMDLRAQSSSLREQARVDERGIMIVEVVVSAVILVVMALATLAVLDRSSALSADNRARSVATGLAQQDQDKVRQWPFSRIDGMFASNTALGTKFTLYNPTPREQDIDGSKYTVQTELEVVSDNGNENTACLAGWQNRKIQITTVATPPPGINIKPVQMRTFRVPTITDQADKGGVIVRLTRGNGDPTVGVPVQVTSMGGKDTDDDGCAVFNDVPAGSTTVTWGAVGGGMVDENGADQVTRTFTLLKGSTAQFSGRFDGAKSPSIKFVDELGNETTPDGQEIVWNSVSVVNSGISTVYNGWRAWKIPRGHTATIGPLFPFETPYGVFAGTCWGNDPTVWEPTTPVTTNWMLLNGAANSGQVVMPKVRVRFAPGTEAAGYRLFAAPLDRVTKMGAGKCVPGVPTGGHGVMPPDGDTDDDNEAAPYKQTGVNGVSTGEIYQALPWGIWTLCIDNVNTNRRYDVRLRVNNTPTGTPGSGTSSVDYEPIQSYTIPAGGWVDGRCPKDLAGWAPGGRVNPTDS
jgi:type II secretory pathway pseudopilin PulG